MVGARRSWLVGLLTFAYACGASTDADPTATVNGAAPGAGVAGGPGGEPGTVATPGVTGPVFPDTLGARFDSTKTLVRIRVYSARATRIDAVFFANAVGETERVTVTLEAEAGSNVRSALVPVQKLRDAGIVGAIYYGFRAWGPNWPEAGFIADVDDAGNRFNPSKVLFDPYGRELSHDPETPSTTDFSAYNSGTKRRTFDTAKVAPKSIVLEDFPPRDGARAPRPTRALKDDAIYEVHVRGFTKNDPSVSERARGTYAGVAEKAAYLRDLGITAVELLPVHETQNDTNDMSAARSSTNGMNYWGYSSLSYFAPDRRYAADTSPGGPTRELAAMVDALHAVGIKVILDVVYNHTGEGGVGSDSSVARVLSYRGLDNATYYELTADGKRSVDSTGTSGNVNVTAEATRTLVLDSLRYWSREVGIDGFRFDLATVLGNSCASACYAFDAGDDQNLLHRAARELPARAGAGGEGVDLIAEPWAIGTGTYQLGHFPAGWSEWNGTFRDSVRSAQNQLGQTPLAPQKLVQKLGGSPDLFATSPSSTRPPAASVNFIASHDGFTLRDVYSYDAKQNTQTFPFGPSDGGDNDNKSWSQNGDPNAQRRAARTGLALVFLSAGVPMITGGDEMFRTQYGNNNTYNLDTEKNWLDWTQQNSEAELVAYARGLFRFRAAHEALRPGAFRTAEQVAWLTAGGARMDATYLNDTTQHFVAFRVDDVYVAYNAWTGTVNAALPAAASGRAWYLAGDSDKGTFPPPGTESKVGANVAVAARSVVALVQR